MSDPAIEEKESATMICPRCNGKGIDPTSTSKDLIRCNMCAGWTNEPGGPSKVINPAVFCENPNGKRVKNIKATGNTKIILKKVGRVQDLLGTIKGLYLQDTGTELVSRGDRIMAAMDEAFNLCLEIRNMYDPIG